MASILPTSHISESQTKSQDDPNPKQSLNSTTIAATVAAAASAFEAASATVSEILVKSKLRINRVSHFKGDTFTSPYDCVFTREQDSKSVIDSISIKLNVLKIQGFETGYLMFMSSKKDTIERVKDYGFESVYSTNVCNFYSFRKLEDSIDFIESLRDHDQFDEDATKAVSEIIEIAEAYLKTPQ